MRNLFFIILLCSCHLTKEQKLFYELGRKKHEIIGAVCESSEFLSKEMVKNINYNDTGKNYLEVGAGTGSFSSQLVENKLNPNSTLDIVEIEPELCEILRKKFATNPNVNVICSSILDWKPNKKYDVIISGLPFNSFDPGFVDSILNHYETLANEDSELCFFEYVLIPTFKKFFSSGKQVSDVVSKFVSSHESESSIVFLNTPPARVIKLKFPSSYLVVQS